MTEPSKKGLLLRLRGLKAMGLTLDDLSIHAGEAWGILGETGAGMDVLAAVLGGDLALVRSGECRLPPDLGLVSFARQQERFEQELREDDTDFLDRPDPGRPARAFLTSAEAHAELIRLFNLEHVLDRGYRCLSSGENRKIAIMEQLSKGVRVLALEHPFDGLDEASCRELEQQLARLQARGLTLILLCSDTADLPGWCSHLALLKDGALRHAGPAARIRPLLGELFDNAAGRSQALFQARVEDMRQEDAARRPGNDTEPLVLLRKGFARYGEVEVFKGLDLTIRTGDHTLITGPNGCGKSTLVQLITGDHPLCYSNNLTIFGHRRGGGETIWEIKRHLGLVSSDLQRSHRVSGSALAIVASGLFDSIGLYHKPKTEELRLAERWLAWLGLSHKASRPFHRLSYGEQRLVLLGRALIKKPRLLLLDEPTQGLDSANRKALLDFLERAAAEALCTIIYISHRLDERRPFFRQHLQFSPNEGTDPFRLTPAQLSV